MKEEILEIPIGQNSLYGILTQPDDEDHSHVILVFTPSALKYSVGPHNFYVRLSRAFVDDNITSLRIDPIGLGYSDGVIDNCDVLDFVRTVEKGRFADEYVAVVKHLRKLYPKSQIYLCGLCGGAVISQLVYNELLDDVSGIIQLNTAVTVSDMNRKPGKGKKQLEKDLVSYLKKLFTIQGWKRIFAKESNFRDIFHTLKLYMKNKIMGHTTAHENVNKLYLDTLVSLYENNTRLLFIFGGNDKRWFEFQDNILNHKALSKFDLEKNILVINDCNHEFFAREWQEEIHSKIRDWIHRPNSH